MEMRRYVRHSPAWWIVGGILALLTAGCIVLGLLAQRDSAAAEAVPIGDEIYLGDYNYIDVQYMTTWAYRVTLGDGRKLVFYLAEDTEGYGYLVQLNDAEYARFADIVDYTYTDDSGDGAVPDDTAAPSELAVYIPLTETTAPAPVRLVGVICETPEAYIDDIAAAVGMTAEDFVYTYGDYYIDSELTPDTGSSFWSLIASFLGLAAFVLLAIVTAVLTGAVYLGFEGIIWFLRLPAEIAPLMRTYLKIVFAGLAAIFLYNYFASLLRALGNSMVPLLFLALSAGLNIALDLWFVCGLGRGVGGAAEATIIAQYVSGVGISVYTWVRFPLVRQAAHSKFKANRMKEIAGFSALTCIQQSIMNLGILAVQGLVNSFGTVVMAAFAAAVKIDAFAYLPVQDFGNAFSIFIAQNYGAQKTDRIHKGIRGAFAAAIGFSIAVSALVFVFAALLMRIFIDGSETAVITEGVRYLRIEGAFYAGIGCLFLFYGLYRAVGRPGMSVVLTVVSLGTRVVLAYALSAIPAIGVTGIWWSVPIGWFLADAVGGVYYWMKKKALFEMK